MYLYDIFAMIFIGMSHIFLYILLIRYNRLSLKMVAILSITFTILLAIVITVTGYPEFNIIMLLIFLLSLGLMKRDLSFHHNLYFALVSMVLLTLVKIVLIEVGMKLFMLSPFNLYLWTGSVIHLIVTMIIISSILLLRKHIQHFAQFIVESLLFNITYVLLVIGLLILFILTMPSSYFLSTLHQQFGQASYTASFILFFVLLLILMISFHLSKEKIIEEHAEQSDKALLDYVKELELMHDELASFRHDYINVLLTLDEGIRTKNIEQVEQIYHDVIAPTSTLINNNELDIAKLSRIHIPAIKSVLSVKLITAKQQQMTMIIDIPEVIESIAIPVTTYIRTISILIDNAIEEAVHSNEKLLQLSMFETEKEQYFILKNSCQEDKVIDLQQIYEKHYSSKARHEGYGLFSLIQFIDKTKNATLETTFSAPYFTQTFILKK